MFLPWTFILRDKHQIKSWRIKNQTDVTILFHFLYTQDSKPTTPKLQHTSNQEQYDQCDNSTEQSQAPDDGYINVRNMLNAQEVK